MMIYAAAIFGSAFGVLGAFGLYVMYESWSLRRSRWHGQQQLLDTIERRGTGVFGHLPAAERPLIKHKRSS